MNHATHLRRQQGFSLLEIMIGLLLGMFSVIIVLQVFSSSDAAKRITNGANDAQLNAMMALNILSRDMRQAGVGLGSFNILGCGLSYTTAATGSDSSATDGAAVSNLPLAPVTLNASLIPAGDASTDTVLVLSGSDGGSLEGDATTALASGNTLAITTASNFATGDWVVAAAASRGSSCALTLGKVTAGGGSTSLTVSTSAFSGLPSGSIVYNLGAKPHFRAYAVRKGNLTVCDYLAYNCGSTSYTSTLNTAVWVPVASHVVSLRAQYARDTSGISGSTSAMTGVADTYDQITPQSSADSSAIAVYCRWARVLGVRLAVVGESLHYDKSSPTTAAPTWVGSSTAPVVLSGASDWQQHRYRLLESSVPLRNIIWQGNQATYQGGSGGC